MLIKLLVSLAGLSASMALTPKPNDGRADTPTANQQRPDPKPLKPGTSRCPDGSIILTTDSCPIGFDHRFEMTHEPHRQERMRRWWCDGRPGKNEVLMSIEYGLSIGSGSSRKQVIELNELIVNGRPAAEDLRNAIQQQLNSFDRLYSFDGRCLFVRSGGAIPVLGLHGVAMKDGKLSRKHEDIPLEK